MMKNNRSKSVKMRKVGNSIVLPVPENIPTTTEEYSVYQGTSGQIIYSPKRANPFLDAHFVETHHFPQTEAFEISHEISTD